MAKRDKNTGDQAALGASTIPQAVPVGPDLDPDICSSLLEPQKLLPPALLQPKESSKGQEHSP